ncbi:unnamed protein product [Ixodes persulcatus]
MAAGNFALRDLMFLADVATSTGLAERNSAAMTAALSPDTPTVSPVVSMPQSTEMSRESTALVAAFAHALQSMQRETPTPKTLIRIPVTEYSGHSDRAMSATDFLLAMQRYRKAIGLTEKETLGRVLPVALVGPAATWHRLVGESAGTLDEWYWFTALFRQEFLPADYLPRMRRELEERTQAPAEPFAEYLRATTNQEQVERVVRQAHPTFSRYLRGRPFGSLSELAQEARRVQADIQAERRYHLPPAPTDTLEPRCAWHGPVPRGYRRGEAAMAAARGEPSGNPWELTDDALEPGSRRGGSAALHATEFRPTGAPRIAAAQEQAAADPLPQRGERIERPTGESPIPGWRGRCFRCHKIGHYTWLALTFRETEEAADKVIGGETDQRAGPRHPIDGVRADGVSSRNSDTHRGPIYFPDSGGKGVRSSSG